MTKKVKAYAAVVSFLIIIAIPAWFGPPRGWMLWLSLLAVVPYSVWMLTVIMEYDDELRGR